MRRNSMGLGLIVWALGTWSWAAQPAVPSAQWPQWQGPTRDNISTDTGLLQKWPEGGPPLLWKATGLGRGYSSVAIAGGHIYTMGDLNGSSCIVALDMDGKNLWSTAIGPTAKVDYPGTRSTPAIDGDLAFGLTQGGEIGCVSLADHKLLWHKNMVTDFGGDIMNGWGYSESVLVDGDNVICTPGWPSEAKSKKRGKAAPAAVKSGTVMALNKKTGEFVWRTTSLMDKASYSSLTVAQIAGQRQYVGQTDSHVFGINPADGTILWQVDRAAQKAAAVVPTPIVRGDDVWVSCGYGIGTNLFHISNAGGHFKAEPVYASHDLCDKHGSDVLVGDYVYGTTDPGFIKCLSFATGKEAWKTPGPLGAFVVAGSQLYFRGEKGTVCLLEATPTAYKVISQFEQPDRSEDLAWAHPVVCGGKLYLRDEEILLCYDLRAK